MYESQKSNNIFRHAGFRLGMVGGIILVSIYLSLLFLFQGDARGDMIGWIIAWFIYLMIGRQAAKAHYETRVARGDALDPTRGCDGAGLGAALTTSMFGWVYFIIRMVISDQVSTFRISFEPILLCGGIIFDAIIAMLLGRWSGSLFANKYKIDTDIY